MGNSSLINLQINPPEMIEIIGSKNVLQAWEWWLLNINFRPNLIMGNSCIFDQKRWNKKDSIELRSNNPSHIINISQLYLISLLGDISETIKMSLYGKPSPIRIPPPKLEVHYRNLIVGNLNYKNKRERFERFRYSLSESLAFWAQLAYLSQTIRKPHSAIYSISRPNFLPDDKGPDGLAVIVDRGIATIELRSVKSSIHDPNPIIASNSFKNNGVPEEGKQLDEFYKIAYESYGLGKLEYLVDTVYRNQNISTNYEIRIGLLKKSTVYNAMVVANDCFASYSLFNSFNRVCSDATRCVATYIGANNWIRFSYEVHCLVEQLLKKVGVL